MAENIQNNAQEKPEFEILNQFIKDLSFEAPNSPKVFFEKIQEKPNMEINLEVKSTPVNEKLFEVVIHVKVKNSLKDNVLYLIDLSYGSMVVLNVEDEETKKTHLLKSVPSYLFPFIRSLVSDLTKDSGFMPFVLQPINFDKLKAEPQVQAPANENK